MKIIILNFEEGKAYVEEIPKKWDKLDLDEVVSKLGYNESDCQYMGIETDEDIEYV